MDLERNKAVVRAFDELGNHGGDLDRLDALCTPNTAPAGCARTWWPRTTWSSSSARALHHPGGRFRGFDVPAGSSTRWIAFAYRLVAGRIAERWAIRDDLAMLLRLGALTPTGHAPTDPAGTDDS